MTPTIAPFERSPDRCRGLAHDMRVRWALEETGQPYGVGHVSFGEMKRPEHPALHPFGQIPTYEEGNLVLFESGANVLHIAERHSGPQVIATNKTQVKSMSKQVFINLPVADLPKSIAFFEALGFSENPQFRDPAGACFAIGDTVLVMLLTHARFRDFTPKVICDTSKAVEVLLSIGCESRAQVDDLVAKALAAGGSTYDKPEDFGFMYSHSFVDPDGHGWGLLHMSDMPPQK